MTDCQTVVDPKLTEASVLYLPADFPASPAVQDLQKRCKVQVRPLPAVITAPGQIDPSKIAPGLLYLENKYVVPGGRFNEMYGWDSYFIILGLVRAGRLDLARGMVDNFFFEIEHYGTILNANRAYYLTRSQPPFLTSMIMEVYEADKAAGHENRGWLEKAYGYASKDYETWNREPHLAGSTGLSRYYDFGNGPAPESLKDEAGSYRKVAGYFLLHPQTGRNYLAEECRRHRFAWASSSRCRSAMPRPPWPSRSANRPEDFTQPRLLQGRPLHARIGLRHFLSLWTLWRGDSSLRSHLPEQPALQNRKRPAGDGGDSRAQGRSAEVAAARGPERRDRIQKYLWDPGRRLFFDYDFETGVRSSYEYITTFYPLWAGLATPEQAQELVRNLGIFEQPGGLAMSSNFADVQWDYPYGWAPTQIVAIEGLRRYGFNDDANRISYNFLATIAENFRRDGTIREKYNVVTRSSESGVHAGYQQNVIGFGWTNAAFLLFLHELPKDMAERLAKEQAGKTPEKMQ